MNNSWLAFAISVCHKLNRIHPSIRPEIPFYYIVATGLTIFKIELFNR